MGKSLTVVIYILALVVTVVVADVLFFRQRFWERLIANVGIVLICVAFYSAFLKNR